MNRFHTVKLVGNWSKIGWAVVDRSDNKVHESLTFNTRSEAQQHATQLNKGVTVMTFDQLKRALDSAQHEWDEGRIDDQTFIRLVAEAAAARARHHIYFMTNRVARSNITRG